MERGGAEARGLCVLRRALRTLPRVPDAAAWSLVVPHTGRTRESQDAGMLTGCLWAGFHRRQVSPVPGAGSLGAAISRSVSPDRYERFLARLTAATDTTLPRSLAGIFDHFETERAAPDFSRLQRDIHSWYRGGRTSVLEHWARDLYSKGP
jgi:hypothetical protein